MVEEKYKYDSKYAKGMKEIYDSNSLHINEGTLAEGMKSAKEYFMNLHRYYTDMANNFKNELLEPSKKMLEDQNSTGTKLYKDVKKLDKNFKEALETLEKMKKKFLEAAKNAEDGKLDAELAKNSYIPQQEKDRFVNKANSVLKDAKEAEKQYLKSIQNANLIRINYIEVSKNFLINFQLLEEQFIEFSKDFLRKFIIYSNVTCKNMIYDTEMAYEKVEFINMNMDINKFIEENQTHLSPPIQIDYVPYSIMLRSKPIEDYNFPHEAVLNVIVTMQNLLEKTGHDPINPVEERKKIKITELSKLACQGDNYTEYHHKLLCDLLKEKNCRVHFLSYLNKYRTNGIFAINKYSFDIIGKILWFILSEVSTYKDYESARYCIILSQTYHYMDEKGNKISLQDKIERHQILQNLEFWENFIAYSIYEEIEKQNFQDSINVETEEDKNNRISNIVFSQLLPSTDNMLSFEVNKEDIKNIILGFAKQYNIPKELNQDLIQMVDEKVYNPKKDVIEENKHNINVESDIENFHSRFSIDEQYSGVKVSDDIIEIIEEKEDAKPVNQAEYI